MDFDFSEEQQEISNLTRQIFEDKVTHERLREIEQNSLSFDTALWETLAKSGIVGAGISESFGGAGLSFLSITAVLELIGEFAAPVPLLETVVMGALPIQEFGTDAQRNELLPRISSGELVLTAGLVPGDTVLVDDGKLSGRIDYVPYGLEAEIILIPTEDGMHLINTSSAGVDRTLRETTMGQRQAMITLDQAAGDRLGSASTTTVLNWIRLRVESGICSILSGTCKASLNLAAEYTKIRHQFDRPIATFQAVSQRAGDAYIDTEAVRLTSRQAAWRVDAGKPAEEKVAIARWWASEAGFRVVHAATHLHGGVGVDRDYPLHRFFLMARQLELTLGNSEEQLLLLGDLIADSA
ncbi:MAG: acyl-CoA dehydrogenase [Actinobacteria bacterium]|nr:acyl-CoA dehydrogenase [Actinomycetota bacterium]